MIVASCQDADVTKLQSDTSPASKQLRGNMSLIEALKKEYNIRVSCDFRWLSWSKSSEQWIVYEKEPSQRGTRELIHTKSLTKAVRVLRGWK